MRYNRGKARSVKTRIKRKIRRLKREFKYHIGMVVALLAVILIFVGAYFLVHGDSIRGRMGTFFGGGGSKQENVSTVTGTLEVHYIDVGQGDATLIKCGDRAMLIDAGENDKGTKVQSYLQSQGISKLDYVIGTHPDSDHIGGLDVILYKFDCGTILMPDKSSDNSSYRDVMSAMKSKSYKQTAPEIGKTYALGDATFIIIAPNKTYNTTNDASIGVLLQFGQKRFLFTGDAESQSESDIVVNGIDIDCDVYKVGHHGSKTSSSVALLNEASPAYAVISCGENNDYGHPHAQTLNELRSRGIKVFRTDEQGTIVATTDGNDIKWNCSPSDSWKAGE